MSKYLIWFVALLGWASKLYAQQMVYVVDAQTRQPVAAAVVHAGGKHILTNEAGLAKIPAEIALPATVSHINYLKKIITAWPVDSIAFISLEPITQLLDSVVVTGSMRPMTRLNSAVPVDSYSQQFLKLSPGNSVFQKLSLVNGVQPQLTCNVCNAGELRINGMDGAYTLVLIDGMPIASSLSAIYGLQGIPPGIVQRIEVIKGAAGALYGSEALGGIINIITKPPKSSSRFGADISAGSYGEYTADFWSRISTKKSDGVLALHGYNYTNKHDVNDDGFRDLPAQQRASLFTRWQLGQGTFPVALAARIFGEERYGGALNFTPAKKGSNEVYGEYISTQRTELLVQIPLHVKGALLDFSHNSHFQNSYYGITKYRAAQQTVFIQPRYAFELSKHHLLVGLPFRYVRYDDNTPATAKPNGTLPSNQTMLGVFAQDEFELDEKWGILSGIRYEINNLQRGVLSPRLAVRFKPDEHHSVRFSAGNGFRIVNLFTEDHAALTGFRKVEIADKLEPERSWSTTLNYSGDLHTGHSLVNLDATLFYTHFSNRIVADYLTDPDKIIYSNLRGFAVSKGANAQINFLTNGGNKAFAGFTFLDVFNNNNDVKRAQLFAARYSGTFGASLLWRSLKTRFDLTGLWKGKMPMPVVANDYRPSYSPAYGLLNFQFTTTLKNSIEFYATIRNVLNAFPKYALLHADDPFDKPGGKYWNTDGSPNIATNANGYSFDPSYNYMPLQGINVLAGLRLNLN